MNEDYIMSYQISRVTKMENISYIIRQLFTIFENWGVRGGEREIDRSIKGTQLG